MNEILLNVLSVLVTAVIIPLISIGGTQLIKLINSKIQNSEANRLLTKATESVTNATRCVFQTYVESLKAEGKFDKESQIKALTQAKNIVLEQLGGDVKTFIQDNFGDLGKWIETQIESTINKLKNE